MTRAHPDIRPPQIQRAAALLETDPAAAEQEARRALACAPGDPRAVLILASSRRRRGDPEAALALLTPLAAAYPNAALTQYELGASRAATGDLQGALQALNAATRLNRDHAGAWQALGEVQFAIGDGRGAEAAFAECRRARLQDPELRRAAEWLNTGRLAEAEALLRRRLTRDPDDSRGLALLADIVGRRDLHADAETLLTRALELDPADADVRFALAAALFHQQKAQEAVGQLERLLVVEPQNAAYQNLMAASLTLIGDFERSLALYEALIGAYERQPRLWLNYGHALRTVGRATEAMAALRRGLTLDPNLTDAYLGLANMKVSALTPEDVAAMTHALDRADLAQDDRVALEFALGQALEDAGDAAGAFDHYARGAKRKRERTPYSSDSFTAFVRASIDLFDEAFFAAREDFGAQADDPIFIVGLPRSGSTLVEQILASHSAVEGTMELPDIGFAARRLGWLSSRSDLSQYPDRAAALSAAESRALGEAYLGATRLHRKLGRRRFIDKMPNNFQHLGLIHLMLPRATIIDVRRHPLAACFSAFKQHFAQGQSFSYDLGDLGRYYRDYVAFMEHFDRVLPGRIVRVIYEDLVNDTEEQVRHLLMRCGLEFEPACLAFHENRRAVRTVSSEQVRRPIYRQGLDQWRNFEAWLGPLKDALGPALETWRGGMSSSSEHPGSGREQG
jgi:tetratricopeptide (TPR) repeat protein